MRKIQACARCKYYATSSHLICALHPIGVANDVETCKDFEPRYQIPIPRTPKVNPGDLKIAESLIKEKSHREQAEAEQILALALAEAMYDPVEELLNRPQSDFCYYVLRLAQLLTSCQPTEIPDESSIELEPNRHTILIYQAKFLLHHGTPEVLGHRKRQFLYGDDYYIAHIISLYLKGGNEFVGRWQKLDLDDFSRAN